MDVPPVYSPSLGHASSEDNSHLDALATKAGSGDWISECLKLYSQASRDEYKLQRSCVESRQRIMREAKRLHEKMMELRRKASERSGIAKIFGIVVGAITAAVSAVVAIYCPPAAAGIGIGGGLVAGTAGVASALENSTAVGYHGRAMLAEQQCQEASEVRSEIMAAMEQSLFTEQRMVERLCELADSEYRSNESALDGLRRG